MKGPMESCGILQEILRQCAAGEKPLLSADTLDQIGKELFCVNAKIRQTISIIIIDARIFFDNDSAWAQWVDLTFRPSNISDRCHLASVGRMLTSMRDGGDCILLQSYCEIFVFSFDKLLVMTRLPIAQIPAFLSHYPTAAKMSREQIRQAVGEYLGESAPVAEQPELPGFEAALEKIVELDFDKVMEVSNSKGFNTETALKMTYSGITLCLASAKSLTEHIDELPAEAIDELLENLDMARSRIAAAVTEHRRKLLNN